MALRYRYSTAWAGIDSLENYVKFFRDSSPYINAHRGKTFVIALSGEAIEHPNIADIIHDVTLLNTLGIRVVLVHGARPQLDARMANCNLKSEFCDNIRVTDQATLGCLKDAIGSTRISLEALLSMGLPNSPMHGASVRLVSGNFVTAKPLGVRNGVDFHHTGEIRRVDRSAIEQQLNQGAVVLVSPIGYSPTGEAFNLSLEEVASQVAISLHAEKLLYFIEKEGIQDTQGQLQKMISLADVRQWQAKLPNDSDQFSALNSAYQAVSKGIPRCHLISYTGTGALLQELFTREGAGTLVLKESQEHIRQATIDDVGGILELIAPLEESGVLVKRSRELLEAEISRFFVMVHPEGMLVGCAALYPINKQSGELACLVSHSEFQNRGLAKRLLAHIEDVAARQNMNQLFVLTTHTAHWFVEQGFLLSDVSQLPEPRQSLYNLQRKSKVLVKEI